MPPGPYLESVPALALSKARAVVARGVRNIVLAADTVVVAGDRLLGKPADGAEAGRMLRLLRRRAHDVITGVAAVDVENRRELTSAALTTVVMGEFDDAAIAAYVATGSPLDKAGGYAIQDVPADWITAVRGSYTNVIGLPLVATRALLGALGVPLLPPSVTEDA